MNASHLSRTAIAAGAVLALVAGGCGSSTHKASSRPPAGPATPPATGLTTYINTVSGIHANVANANSRFFHAPRSKRLAQARTLERAYASAAHQLEAIRPPRAGTTEAHALLGAWQSSAHALAAVAERQPFNSGHAWTVAVHGEQTSEQAFGSVVAIP